ncbi:MAG: purine-nucleoside/S-methyl-5-thioadenosine phosphorylase / adenosine deaminase [Actinomycetota bacterium]|jgi:YfiH family protein|nr:purine-nucleoside/S-methyl-5-thioadenosine phosphorylase / adenosine deaminase [Actinomycetota bacterium]
MTFEPRLTATDMDGVPMLVDPGAPEVGAFVAFTGRRGGTSAAPWAELNLSDRVGDDAAAVERNRKRVAAALEVDAGRFRFARQVHGSTLLMCDGSEPVLVGEADALATSSEIPVLGILTADCVPVLIAGDRGVAAAHAGWRGLVAGVIEEAVAAIGSVRVAWVGPSIKACCYEVGAEVVEAFRNAGLPVADASHVDPGDAAVAALRRAGVTHIAASEVCTASHEGYYSYRRDGDTGRQGAFIGLVR